MFSSHNKANRIVEEIAMLFFWLHGIVHFLWAASFALMFLDFEFSIPEVFYNLITKKSKYFSKFGSVVQSCLVLFLSLLKVWANKYSNEWAKKSFLLEKKNSGLFIQHRTKVCFVKTLVWSAYVWKTVSATFVFLSNIEHLRLIYELGSHFNQIRFIKRNGSAGSMFLFYG